MVLKSPLPSADTTISGFGKFPANLEHDGTSKAGRSNANKTIRRSMPGALPRQFCETRKQLCVARGLRAVRRCLAQVWLKRCILKELQLRAFGRRKDAVESLSRSPMPARLDRPQVQIRIL